MLVNIGKEVAALQRMTLKELQAKYAEIFSEATRVGNKAWLIKRIAWRLQSLGEGDLSERARSRAAELARDADLRLSPPRMKVSSASPELIKTVAFEGTRRVPVPGTVITKQYKGRTLAVHVLPDGFEFEGERFKSLSALANQITGSHCNGYHFFGLNQREEL